MGHREEGRAEEDETERERQRERGLSRNRKRPHGRAAIRSLNRARKRFLWKPQACSRRERCDRGSVSERALDRFEVSPGKDWKRAHEKEEEKEEERSTSVQRPSVSCACNATLRALTWVDATGRKSSRGWERSRVSNDRLITCQLIARPFYARVLGKETSFVGEEEAAGWKSRS